MKIEEFIKKHKLYSREILYYINKEGKKQPYKENNSLSIEKLNNDEQNFNDLIIKFKKLHNNEDFYKCFSIYLRYTPNLFVIDIDEDNITLSNVIKVLPFSNKTSYTKGNSKGFHFYLYIEEFPFGDIKRQTNVFKDIKGDLLRNTNSWERIDKEVFNYNNIISVKWNKIKKYFIDVFNKDKSKKNKKSKEKNIQSENISKSNNDSINKFGKIHNISRRYNIGKIHDLLSLLDDKRCNDYDTWLNVGYVLNNTNSEDKLLLNEWREWSKRNNKFEENYNNKGIDCCEYYWLYNFKNNSKKILTLGSLHYWAKQDNSYGYMKLNYNEIMNILAQGELTTAEYVGTHHRNKIIISKRNYYRWNNILKLWEQISKETLKLDISSFIRNTLHEMIDIANKNENLKEVECISKLIKSSTSNHFIEGITSYLKGILLDEEFEDKLDVKREVINFKNGLYDLIKKEFRNREKEDYISQCLSYDYIPKSDEDITNEIRRKILNISNDSEELYEFNLSWLGYCLTGETKEQKFLVCIGYSAGNGKTTLAKMYTDSLSIYGIKLANDTFNKDCKNRHKYIINMKKPNRFSYIEELDEKKLNVKILKDFVSGDKINNEIMYGTSEDIKIYCKLYFTSNKDPKFDTDEGVRRRGLLEKFNNKFLDKKDYMKRKNEKGIYEKDNQLDEKFNKEEYKMGFVNLLIPYGEKYYESGLYIPDSIKENFNELCDDNDPIYEFLTERYEITKDENDKIHKDDFLSKYNEYYKSKCTFNQISSDIKRYLTYDREKRMDKKRGAILGIKEIEKDNTSEDNSDEEVDEYYETE